MTGHRVTETELFRLLVSREPTDGLEAAQVSAEVNLIVEEAWPVLQQVTRAFPLYTLHDPEHSYRVAQNMYRLVPERTLESLNSIELSILLYAAYFHDIGMASSQEEFYQWVNSTAYEEYVSSRERWSSALRHLRVAAPPLFTHDDGDDEDGSASTPNKETSDRSSAANELGLRCLQDIIYTDYLRETHAERGAVFATARHGDRGASRHRIQIGEVNYAQEVALVCRSHWDNPSALKATQYRRDLYIGRYPVNLQYLAVILRLADLVELDPERTPATVLDFIMLDLADSQSSETPLRSARSKSAQEWAKHRAILGYKITSEEIRIEARCSHPAIQRGLLEWCEYIDAERRECRIIVRENPAEIATKYCLDLSVDVRKEYIQSDDSYIYADFRLQLDYDRIVSLLMGTQLWGDASVVVRELLQNALDACSHRSALSRRHGIGYTPKITFNISYEHDRGRTVASLSCEDNGTGMSREIIERYLMRVGSSYYQSGEFRRQNLDFTPISQFGLGVMSCFMLSDQITIETQHVNESLAKGEPLRVEMDSAGRYVVLRPLSQEREGTCVSIPVKHGNIFPFDEHMHHMHHMRHVRHMDDQRDFPDERDFPRGGFPDGTLHVLHELAIHLDVPIEVSYGGRSLDVIEPGQFVVPEIQTWELPCMKDRFKEFVFDFTHEQGRGIAGKFRFLLPTNEEGIVSFGETIDSRFKLFIDDDGDLCVTAPHYETKDLHVEFDVSDDWDTDEIRGVYRYKYGRKPATGKWDSDDDQPSSVLERVPARYRWSQDGLLVGWLSQAEGHEPSSDRQRNEEQGASRRKLFELVPVPGLNAADIDLRDHARISLNVQRSDFQRGASLDAFEQRYYALAAEMWHRILIEADALPPSGQNSRLLDVLLRRARQPLIMQLQALIPHLLDDAPRSRRHQR